MENQDDSNASNAEEPYKHTTAKVETDYEAHKANPLPAPTVNEPEDSGAGPAMKWVIPIAIAVLLLVWYFFFKDNMSD